MAMSLVPGAPTVASSAVAIAPTAAANNYCRDLTVTVAGRVNSSCCRLPRMATRGLSSLPTDEGGDSDSKAGIPTINEKEEEPMPSSSPSSSGEDDDETAEAEDYNELNKNLKPSEIVEALNRHIVGQPDAKKSVAIAMRNRWRRRQLPEELRKEVTPRNVLLVGPTG